MISFQLFKRSERKVVSIAGENVRRHLGRLRHRLGGGAVSIEELEVEGRQVREVAVLARLRILPHAPVDGEAHLGALPLLDVVQLGGVVLLEREGDVVRVLRLHVVVVGEHEILLGEPARERLQLADGLDDAGVFVDGLHRCFLFKISSLYCTIFALNGIENFSENRTSAVLNFSQP